MVEEVLAFRFSGVSFSTAKDYNNVTVSGNIGDLEIVDFDYTGSNVFTGTSFAVIK